jgi:hypothetical protein
MQGIQWKNLPVTRGEYRAQRIQNYQNYANITKDLRERYNTLREFLMNGVRLYSSMMTALLPIHLKLRVS